MHSCSFRKTKFKTQRVIAHKKMKLSCYKITEIELLPKVCIPKTLQFIIDKKTRHIKIQGKSKLL